MFVNAGIGEAHKLRNVYRKSAKLSNILKRVLQPYKKVLLTATPLQNNLKELYGLIVLLTGNFSRQLIHLISSTMLSLQGILLDTVN